MPTNFRFNVLGLPLLLVAVPFCLVNCSNDSWTSEEKEMFVKGCKSEGASSSYCDCFMEKVMKAYPKYDDSKNIDFETAVELSSDCE